MDNEEQVFAANDGLKVIPGTGTLVEGVGDEVVKCVVSIVLILPLVVYALRSWFSLPRNQVIHRDSETQVDSVRRLRTPPIHTSSDSPTHCPICLGNLSTSVQTNCGHVFCGSCIVHYWRVAFSISRPINCPVCRQNVTFLVILSGNHAQDDENYQSVVEGIEDYNRRFSGEPRPFMDYIRDLPVILRHILRDMFTLNGLVWWYRLRVYFLVIAAAAYLISPLDLLPEAAFGILGILDDLFIVMILLIYATVIYRNVYNPRQ